LHEIKYDGYRLQAHVREGRVQLFTRRGYDWTDRFESVALAAWELKTYGATIDGEGIVPTARGQSDFHALERDLGGGRTDVEHSSRSSRAPFCRRSSRHTPSAGPVCRRRPSAPGIGNIEPCTGYAAGLVR